MAALLLNAVTVSGPSLAFKVTNAKEHTVQIDWTGSVTAMTVDLEATLGNQAEIDNGTVFWSRLAEHELNAGEIAAKTSMFQVLGGPVRRVRINITTLTGPGIINVRYQGYDGGLRQG